MRNTKKLLMLVLEHLDEYMFNMGLCHVTTNLQIIGLISLDEEVYIDKYIKHNMPETFYPDTDSLTPWGWPAGEKEPRRSWLENEIKSLS